MHNQRDPHYFDLYRVDLLTGASELLFENREYYGLFTDSEFRLQAGLRLAAMGRRKYFERQPAAAGRRS